MNRLFAPLAVVTALMFAAAPFYIATAPYEAAMGMVQRIFYFHVPSWFAMFTAAFICGIESTVYLFRGKARADRVASAAAELTVVFGLCGLVTGPLWARKSWGVWWQWDARLTMALVVWMIFFAYLLLRKFGGPGSEKLAAAVAIFGMANIPFVYVSVNWWRTIHPTTNVIPTLPAGMPGPLWFSALAFMLLLALLLTLRVRLEDQRARLEALYLAIEE